MPRLKVNKELYLDTDDSIMGNNEINVSKEAARPKFLEA
jgi:hypothetical protein